MTEEEKDAWIISQAKILPDRKQEDFYKSLCGTKKIINMPERSEIAEFCQKVSNGEITVVYYTYYEEFDGYGFYHGDWEHEFYDPDYAMKFISSVIKGCHDLVILEEYEQAFEILDEIINLKFAIEDHPETEDNCEYEQMDLNMAVYERILLLDTGGLLRDYIESCRHSVNDASRAAEKIVEALEMELFKDCETYSDIIITEKDPLLPEIKKKLTDVLNRYEKEHAEKREKKGEHYWDEFYDMKRIGRISALIEYYGKIGNKQE